MRRKKQRSKKNVMAPAKRRQEEGAGVKSCQRKDDLLRFEDTDCFQMLLLCENDEFDDTNGWLTEMKV